MTASPKTQQILDSSLAVFCRYGFAKTTMSDLAEAAGVSRATLYLHFSNKEAVFRAGSERAHAAVMAEVEERLGADGPAIGRIDAAMNAYLRGLMEEIGASPHGRELFDSNLELSADITLAARRRLTDRIAEVLAEADTRGEIGLSALGATPRELAGLILASAEGIKLAGGPGARPAAGSALFMRILGAATAP